MANVDYVMVGRGPSPTDVMELVRLVSGATDVVKTNVLITGDDRTSLTVRPSASRPGSTLIDIYYGGDIADRRAISQRIFDYIVEHTDWDVELDSDDADGKTVETSDLRPSVDQVVQALPNFVGTILQRPPAFSAIKIAGERAYDLARDGEIVEIEPRPVTINSLELVSSTDDTATLEAQCGKGTYVRAIARDLGRALGCFGHVTALRRTRVGPFQESDFITAADLTAEFEDPAEQEAHAAELLAPVDRGLTEIPDLNVSRNDAARLKRGQGIILRGRDAPAILGQVAVHCGHELIAIGEMDKGELKPHRVFNLA